MKVGIRLHVFLVFYLITVFCFANDTQRMMTRLQKSIMNALPVSIDDEVTYKMGLFDGYGRYESIDYSSRERVVWEPSKHYSVLRLMAAAYVSPSSRYYKDASLYSTIVKGLEFWYKEDPESDNWWWEQIDEQLGIGETLILMKKGKKRIPKALEDSLVTRMKRNGGDPERWTGANKAHIAQHWLYRGLLTKDKELIKTSVDYLYEVISYNDGGEGFQVDGSYFQHGQQLYLGGYAELLLNSVLRIAWVTKGTRYKLGDRQLDVVKQYLKNTIPSVIRGQYINYNCIGRNLSRIGELAISNAWAALYRQLKELKVSDSDCDEMMIRLGTQNVGRYTKPYHHHFYKGDYTVHVRPKYSYSVRLSSPRTVLNETLSSENLLGYFVSYGGSTIERKGDEYYNIMPLWDWYSVPGTTAPYMEQIPVVNQFYQKGIADYCGGVSDSLYGVSAIKYNDQYHGVNTSATKAWFFFDDEVVCLGSGIKSDYETNTSVNQCREKGVTLIKYRDNNYIQTGLEKSSSSDDVSWVIHDSIVYFFPQVCKVEIETDYKEANWNVVNKDFRNAVEKGRVFKLSINHGIPNEGNYQYIVVPGVGENTMIDYEKQCPIEIVRNDGDVQIVYHKGLKMFGVVFYKAQSVVTDRISIQVSEPCIMLLDYSDFKHVGCHIQDISYQGKKIDVQVQLSKETPMQLCADFRQVAAPYAGSSMKVLADRTPLR